MWVAQAVECYVAHFHANNYKYNKKLLPEISQYFYGHVTVWKYFVVSSQDQDMQDWSQWPRIGLYIFTAKNLKIRSADTAKKCKIRGEFAVKVTAIQKS